MFNLNQLNPEQRQAVVSIKGPMLILAGAGTGKTRVITYRISHMLALGVPPEKIVAVTFTNKAAREMRERLIDLVGKRAQDLVIGTFHSFCIKLLRHYANEAGLRRNFNILDTADQQEIVRKAIEELSWAMIYQPSNVHFYISQAKNQLVEPEQLVETWSRTQHPCSLDLQVVAHIYQMYERIMKLNNAVDFDDCIYKCVKLLERNPETAAEIRAKIDYLLVDEYQDTNFAQLRLIELLANKDHNVCVVGDDDQSIYSWRGAMYETIEQFEKLFPTCKLVKLEQNYRCSNHILGAANQVIRNNAQRKDKTLWSDSKIEHPIVVSVCESEVAEGKYVGEQAFNAIAKGHKLSDICVLYRANNQAKHIELGLREYNLRYQTFGGQSFFDNKEVKDFVAYLRLIINPEDRLALWRIINTPHRGIGIKTIERLEKLSLEWHKSPLQILLDDQMELKGSAKQTAHDFVAGIMEFHKRPLTTSAEFNALCQQILATFKLENDIKLRIKDTKAQQARIQNLRELPQFLFSLAQDLENENNGVLSTEKLLDSLSLNDINRSKEEMKGDYISLMTIHGAKGLEFPIVFIVGAEEELLPHKNSVTNPKDICEERRLFYVAITRAKIKLYITYCHYRNIIKTKVGRTPSRFLKELPQGDGTERHQAVVPLAVREEQRKQQTLSKLSSLRASLDLD